MIDILFYYHSGGRPPARRRRLSLGRAPARSTAAAITRAGARPLDGGGDLLIDHQVVSLAIDYQVVSLVIDSRVSGLKSFFYRKIDFCYRKNDQEKISEIFVHLAPENTRLNQLSEKSPSKKSF